MMGRHAAFTWTGRLAVLALATAAVLHRPVTYTAANVHLHNGLLYGKNNHPANGQLELSYADGNPLLSGKIMNGRFSGIVDEWYPDGKRRARYEYMAQGDVVSVSTWYPNGDLAELYEMQRGPSGFVYASRYLSWYQGGGNKHVAKYLDGKPQGLEAEWDEAGKHTLFVVHGAQGPTQYLMPDTLSQAGVNADSEATPDEDADGQD